MKTGQSIIDQIQDALGEMEDTGFLDDLVKERLINAFDCAEIAA